MANTPFIKKILIVEDHPLFRNMLVQLINREPGMTVCGEVDNPEEALALIEQVQPDAAVVDLTLHGSSGLELIKELQTRNLKIPVLVISMHAEHVYAERVLRAGAKGYVSKQAPPMEVVTAIRKILAGDIHVSHGVDEAIFKRLGQGEQASPLLKVNLLSDLELNVFQLIGRGLDSREIAGQLKLDTDVMARYQAVIMGKLGIKNIVEIYQNAAKWLAESRR